MYPFLSIVNPIPFLSWKKLLDLKLLKKWITLIMFWVTYENMSKYNTRKR